MNDDKEKLQQKKEESEMENIPFVDNAKNGKVEGSGIFTADGKELPKIDGGYDFVGPDSGLGDNDYE